MSVLDVSTSVVTRLAAPGSLSRNLSWSPDGSQGVFDSAPPNNVSQIYRMEVDGSGVVRLTDISPGASDPAWSPCGTQIAFTAQDFPRPERAIHVMDSDGSNVQVLTDERGSDFAPSWSPGCSKIAFSSDREAAVENALDIWIVNVDGSGLRKLTRRE